MHCLEGQQRGSHSSSHHNTHQSIISRSVEKKKSEVYSCQCQIEPAAAAMWWLVQFAVAVGIQ